MVKNLPVIQWDPSLIHGSGRSPGEGNGNSLNYSCLENPVDRGVWWATVHGIAKNQTQLSDLTLPHTFSFCFTDYTKAFDCLDHSKLWKILKEMGILDHLNTSWETCMRVKKWQLEPGMEEQTGSNWGKEYGKTIYCHPAHLTSMQSSSCEMPGCINHKLESRLLREISTTSNMQIILL